MTALIGLLTAHRKPGCSGDEGGDKNVQEGQSQEGLVDVVPGPRDLAAKRAVDHVGAQVREDVDVREYEKHRDPQSGKLHLHVDLLIVAATDPAGVH
jgi:hypothetical protein